MNKITLITHPDFFENSNRGILFINLNDQDQDIISQWLFEKNLKEDINIYVYNGEPNIQWLFYAFGCCRHKYIDIDNSGEIVTRLGSYMLSKPGVFYKTDNENTASIYSHINNNRIDGVITFLERAFSE